MEHKKWLEIAKLFWIRLQVFGHDCIELARTIYRYYPNYSFCKADLLLKMQYLFSNPYTISKKYLMQRGALDVYAYGETPLSTVEKIAQECELSSSDTIFELGCGRGFTTLWFNQILQCKAIGIEQIPIFVKKAQGVADYLQLNNIEFLCQDILQTDYSSATCIYFFGTNFDDEFVYELTATFAEQLLPGTKIITISYSLAEYAIAGTFTLVKEFSVDFAWGSTTAYLQYKA